jgi:hypothetical protein
VLPRLRVVVLVNVSPSVSGTGFGITEFVTPPTEFPFALTATTAKVYD